MAFRYHQDQPDFEHGEAADAAAPALPADATDSEARSVVRLRAILDKNFDFIWRSVRRLGVNEGDVDDVAQEVCLVAARRMRHIEPGKERAFLFGTVQNLVLTYKRRARRRPQELTSTFDAHETPNLDPEALTQLSSARSVLQGILNLMSPDQRPVFVLCELEEMSSSAAAEALGVPAGTVSSRLRSAREVFNGAVRRLAAREKREDERLV